MHWLPAVRRGLVVIAAALLVGGCGRADPAVPVALESQEECPPHVRMPRSETGSAAWAAVDYIVFDGEVYNRDFSDASRNERVEVGDQALVTICRLGFQSVPKPLQDGHASSLPVGTPVFHVVGEDDALVVDERGQQIVYRPASSS